jgi:hypothetical protein
VEYLLGRLSCNCRLVIEVSSSIRPQQTRYYEPYVRYIVSLCKSRGIMFRDTDSRCDSASKIGNLKVEVYVLLSKYPGTSRRRANACSGPCSTLAEEFPNLNRPCI